MKILVIDSQELLVKEYCLLLEHLGHEYFCVDDVHLAIDACKSNTFDMFIINIDECLGSLPKLMLQIRACSLDLTEWKPIIVVSESEDDDTLLQAINAGGDDFIKKPVKLNILEAKIKSLRRIMTMRQNLIDYEQQLKLMNDKLFSSTEVLSALVLKDPLTLLPNQRGFEDYYHKTVRACSRKGEPVCLVMVEIDQFDAFQEFYGAKESEDCLIRVSQALSSQLHRPADFISRFSPKALAIILPETPMLDGAVVCDRLRQAVCDLKIQHPSNRLGVVSVSFGLACACPDSEFQEQQLITASQEGLSLAQELQNSIYYCELSNSIEGSESLSFNKYVA